MATPPKRFAPPPTRYGQTPGTLPVAPTVQPRAKQATLPPPPTRFGAAAAPVRVGQAKPAGGGLNRAAPPPSAPHRPPANRQTIQRMGLLRGIYNGVSSGLGWVGNRIGDYMFGDLGRAAAEGLAEGVESLDEYLYSREGDYSNLSAHRYAADLRAWDWVKDDLGEDAILCYQEKPRLFTARVKSGRRFLWVATVDGRLVVGDIAGGIVHAILARGMNVHGAGEGQRRSGNTVVLDFESGHYQPKSGWRPSMNAWSNAGFFAVVDRNAHNR